VRRWLALDTSTWWGSVALIEHGPGARDARAVLEVGGRVDGSHAEHLLSWIARLLAETGWSKSSLDAYAATRGPGSFTGIRVGLGTAQGLALASGRPCFGVTTLEAIAEAHGADEHDRVPVLDAGRGQLYSARYDPAGSPPVTLRAPWVGDAAAVLEQAVAAAGTIIRGPGTSLAAQPEGGWPRLRRAAERIAGAAGRVASLRAAAGEAPQPLTPLYLRPPDALLKHRP